MSARHPATVGPLERALLLRSLPLFHAVRGRELAVLAQVMREETVAAGTVLQHAGRRVHAVRLVTQGRVALWRDGRSIARREAPEALGLLELLAVRPAEATAIAEVRTTSLRIDDAALLDVLEDDLGLVIHLRTALGRLLAAREAERGSAPLAAALPAAPAASGVATPGFVDRLLWLQRAPALRPLGVAVLADLLRSARDRRLAAGEVLFEGGADGDALYVLTHGWIDARMPGQPPQRVGAGAVLGENAALAGVPHAYTAVAAAPSRLIGIGAQAFWDVAEDHVHVGRATLADCARRLLQLDPVRSGAITAAPPYTRSAT